MWITLLVVVGLAGAVACQNQRERLAQFPKSDPNFDIVSWGHGDWYSQARYIPRSFSGSKDFTNIRFRNVLSKGVVQQFATWRVEDVCTTVLFQLTPALNTVGAFLLKDPIGDVMTGKQIVVQYNLNQGYNIIWGCTKVAVEGWCADPWVTITTRDRVPAPPVWDSVNRELNRLWGMSLREFNIIPQKQPCV